MAPWPQYSLSYLLLLVFWWAAMLAVIRVIASESTSDYAPLCFLLSPLAIGPALGGLFLRMRFGFLTGLALVSLMLLFLLLSP
jgi:hypothetical protein